MASNERALVAETKALIKEVESGDTAHAAWVAIQDRVKLLYEGRSQAAVGDLLGRSESWIGAVLRWNPHHGALPLGGAKKLVSNERSSAKKVLADPEQRAKVIESLSEDERLEVAKAAMEPAMRDVNRGAKERQAHRESKPARERGIIELISAQLDGADLNILSATHTANDTTWDDPEVTAMAEGRIDRTAMRLDLLRMAIRSDGDIGAELARIEEEA